MAALTIARLTIREASRRRLLLALAVLTVIVIGLTGWGFQHLTTLTMADGTPIPASELRLATSQVLVLVEFMFSGVLALSAVVVASPSISSEVESGVALSILARPVSRYQVVVGKWLGQLGQATLTDQRDDQIRKHRFWRRVVIEKPFGHSLPRRAS
jgi:ABC-type transport system involved in multi-copper enzyme maturation permease subunit